MLQSSRKLTSASSLSELKDGCGTKSVGNNWRFYSLSVAVPFASSEDSSVVLIGADSVSSLCRRVDFALLCLVLLQTATCYENNAAR